MNYLEFIQQTREMKPSEKSKFFHELSEEDKDELIETTHGREEFSLEYFLLQVRIHHAAEGLENEPNEFKKAKYEEIYDELSEHARRYRMREVKEIGNP